MDTIVNIRATIFRYALHPPTVIPRNTMMGSTALVSIKRSPEFALASCRDPTERAGVLAPSSKVPGYPVTSACTRL